VINRAARIESPTRKLDANVLISSEAYTAVSEGSTAKTWVRNPSKEKTTSSAFTRSVEPQTGGCSYRRERTRPWQAKSPLAT
jgi:hypothetical protein